MQPTEQSRQPTECAVGRTSSRWRCFRRLVLPTGRFFIVPQGRSGLLLVQWHGRKHWPLPVEPLTPAALVEAEHDRSRTLGRAQVVPRLLDRLRL
jgi:hypothetical protein